MHQNPTIGVEEQFLLGVHLQLELTSCQVETTSSVVSGGDELYTELSRLRRIAADGASACGTWLLAVGLPPSVPHHFPVTDTPRYRRIGENFGMIAHEQGICGCHVHVAVTDRESAIQVSNWLRPWLPLLLALTANSAIYRSAEFFRLRNASRIRDLIVARLADSRSDTWA